MPNDLARRGLLRRAAMLPLHCLPRVLRAEGARCGGGQMSRGRASYQATPLAARWAAG